MSTQAFDPTKYLTKVSGKDYLEVKFRILWARTVQPDISIVSELTHYGPEAATFKATVSWPTETGIVVCQDWGSEESSDFGDFMEKASTKAIGRALSLAGFGTQFTNEHEFGADQQRVVDSPVQRSTTRPAQTTSPPDTHTHTRPPGELASEAQTRMIYGIIREKDWTDEQLHARILIEYGVRSMKQLKKAQASDLITYLKQPLSPALPHEIADEFLSDANALQAAQTIKELHAIWKVQYVTWEGDPLALTALIAIKDARKAELAATE